MFLKQGNYQKIYVCQETLHFRICKKKNESKFENFFTWYLKLEQYVGYCQK